MEHKIYLVDGVWVAKHLLVFQFRFKSFQNIQLYSMYFAGMKLSCIVKSQYVVPAVIFAFIASMKKNHIIRFNIFAVAIIKSESHEKKLAYNNQK